MNFEFGKRYALAANTGVMAAALAANSPVFAMRLNPAATVRARIDRLRFQWTCITAFTVPITAGRRLEVIRGSGAAAAAGTLLTDLGKRFAADSDSQFDDGAGGDVRISAAAALTFAGTVEPTPLKTMNLAHVGAAGAFQDREYCWRPSEHDEIVLQPGEILLVRNPVVMDAAGTFQLAIEVDWRESRILT